MAISGIKDNEQLKNKYIPIRLQLIMAFNQLRDILGFDCVSTKDRKGAGTTG
jgi:hypothetical protein